MKICWVISEEADDQVPPGELKTIAEAWGSWRTWKSHRPDNCICSNTSDAKNLIQRAFHAVCTLYIMQDSYAMLGNPSGVRLFNGQFKNNSISNKDDIIALNLAAPQNDIILLYGFNLYPIMNEDDSRNEYYFNVSELIKANPKTQFVIVDHSEETASWISELDNVTFDSIDNVKSLLSELT